MKKTVIFAAITTAIGMASTGITYADDTTSATPPQLEKCQINKDGKSFIKEHMADCKTTSSHSCMGNNSANDSESWVFVPQGECAKINACDFSGMTDNVKSKIDMDAFNQACGSDKQGAQDVQPTNSNTGAQSTTPSTTDGTGAQSTQPTTTDSQPATNDSTVTQTTQPATDGTNSDPNTPNPQPVNKPFSQ